MFAGVLTAGESPGAPTDAANLAADMARFAHVRSQSLLEDTNLTLFTLARDRGSSHYVEAKPAPGVTVWLYRLDQPVAEDSELVDTLSRHDWNSVPSLPGLWLALVWNQHDKSCRIITDRIGGVWLYIARTANGFAFSCDFASLARLIGPELHLDLDTALLELVLGYTPGERTLSREIFLPQPGAVTELRGQDLRIISRSDFDFGDRYASSSRKEKFAVLDGIFERITKESLHGNDQILSLSAGFDSRYALGLMTSRGISCPLATFGDPESVEVDGARAVASIVGRETDLFTFTEADWGSWARCIRTLGNSGMVQWSGWAEQWLSFLRDRAGGAIIGFLGDTLSGKHLHPRAKTPEWRLDWLRWSAGPWATSPLLSRAAKERFRKVAEERFSELSLTSNYAFPHQEALHFDLRGRQRRWVASQPNLMARYVAPVTFFCDDELYDFWTNVSQDDLLKQTLYLEYAHSRLATFFPRTTTKTSLIERMVKKGRRVAARMSGRQQRVRPQVVGRGHIASQNKERILALIDDNAQPIEELVDVRALRMAVEVLDENESIDPQFSLLLIQFANLLLVSTSATKVDS